jgi:hypothetical protein
VPPYPTIASYIFSDKSQVAFRTYADSCGSGSDALWPVTAGSMLPLSTKRRGMVGALTREGCRYAEADMLFTETSYQSSIDTHWTRGPIPFEAIYAPQRSGDCFLIPVPAGFIGQPWIPEFGFQLRL